MARVIGTVVAERKDEGLEGKKLLLVQPLDHHGRRTRDPQAAVDTVQAGDGDLVYLVGSREAALALDPWFVPVDAAIVGIVDDMNGGGEADDMKLCRVEGTSSATVHHPAFDGQKLFIVQPVDGGDSFLAIDRVQAGVGDTVLVNQEGNGMRQLLKQGAQVPIRSLIVGIVDEVRPR